MPVTASFVRVAPDSTGKKMDNVHLTNPNADEVEREAITLGDPEVWGQLQRVLIAMPPPGTAGTAIREVAPEYDSGIMTLPNTLSVLTTDTIRAHGILLVNRTAGKRDVTVTNTAGDFYLKDFELQRKQTVFIPLGRATMIGVKWNTDQADAVNAQLIGEK
jgi:hypothetical protein